MDRVRDIALFAAILAGAGCGGGADSGRLSDPGPQVAAVGQDLNITLELGAAQGQVDYSFDFDHAIVGDNHLVARPDGSALFTLRPTGQDLGDVVLHVSARDQVGFSELDIPIEVRSTVGSATLPRFNRPQGEGTAMEVKDNDCIEIEVEVDDQDTADVDIVQVPPLIEGGNLQKDGEGQAVWRWCPTPEQRAERDRYVLTLGADDRENPKALKRYLIVLHEGGKIGCPGAEPVIEHTPADYDGLQSIDIEAHVTDVEGLDGAPLVYFVAGDQVPRSLGEMQQLTMELESGDDRDGQWVAHIPHPGLHMPAGQSVALSYIIVAGDNDGRGNGCNHQVKGSYSIKVSHPEGGEGAGLCEPCDADVQCGGEADLCMNAGTLSQSYCFTACDSDATCPSGFYCSPEPLTSVDGATGRQCVPEDDVCEVSSCPDDRFEPNGRASDALDIEPGTTSDLMMCPIGHLTNDEDWYHIPLEQDSDVSLVLNGDVYPNMDLRVFDAEGKLVAASEDWGSTDSIQRCLPAGDYYARVYSSFAGENAYSLDLTTSPGSCPISECVDDAFEDDDEPTQDGARVPDFEASVYRQPENHICAGDQDYYYVYLFGDETIYGTLTFEETTSSEDLDFLVYDGDGNLLIQCTADDLSGCTENGQSGTSNEDFEFTAPTEGEYYVVVNGFDGAENDYAICLSLDSDMCP